MLSTYFIITIKVIFLNQCTIYMSNLFITHLFCLISSVLEVIMDQCWYHNHAVQQAWLHFLVDYWLSNEEYLEAWEWSLAMAWWIVCLLSSWKLDQNLVLIRYLLLWSDSEDIFYCEKLSEHHLVESKSIVMIGTYLLCTLK